MGFAVYNPTLDVCEPCDFQKSTQLHFGEAHPRIGIEIARLLEAVLLQIKNDDPAARLKQN